GYLERAVAVQPSSWQYQLRLAAAYMSHQDFDKAEQSAMHALESGKDRAVDAHLILAQAYARKMDGPRVLRELEPFVRVAPTSPQAPQVRELIAKLSLSPPRAPVAEPAAEAAIPVIALPPATGNVPLLATSAAVRPKWLPADVDDTLPPVEPGVACPLEKI